MKSLIRLINVPIIYDHKHRISCIVKNKEKAKEMEEEKELQSFHLSQHK